MRKSISIFFYVCSFICFILCFIMPSYKDMGIMLITCGITCMVAMMFDEQFDV
jgi:hypothetical protein